MDRKSNFSPFKKWLQVLDSREISGAPGEIRTPDPLLRRQMLYPAELRARGRSHSDSKAFAAVPKIKYSSFQGSPHITVPELCQNPRLRANSGTAYPSFRWLGG